MSTETMTKPGALPRVKGGAVPYLSMDANAGEAADFYKRAFAAEEGVRVPADDGKRMMHVHLYINGSSVMMSDSFPEHGHPFTPFQGFSIHLQVDDIDAWFKRAVDAGCEVVMPIDLMFWGDRYGVLRDPYGVTWAMGMTPNA